MSVMRKVDNQPRKLLPQLGHGVAREDDGDRRISFNYAVVPPSVANFLQGQADRIRRLCVSSAVQTGKALLEAKRYLSHGEFLAWIELEVGISARAAQLYMRAAQWVSKKHENVSHLSPSMLYILSASSTPEELRQEVLNRLEAGERIKVSAIRTRLRRLKEGGLDEPPDSAPSMHGTAAPSGMDARAGIDQLSKAIAILARELPTGTFALVRDLLTSSAVLDDPELPKKLVAAFSTPESARAVAQPHGQDKSNLDGKRPVQLERAVNGTP